MTDLSFNNYISRARENLDGTVRVAKSDDSQLINHKGGFGNKVATFFKNIASVFGYTDESRAGRNQAALDGFKRALTQHFGADIALKAWGDKNLDDVGKLTGKTIIEVANHAQALRHQNFDANVALYWDCRPIDNLRTDYPGGGHFGEICEKAGYDRDFAKTLKPEQLQAYKERLDVAFNEATRFDSIALTPDQAKDIASDVLKQVVKLDLSGGLGEAQKVRQAYVDSVKTLVTDIADGRSSRRLLESLVAMNKCSEQLLQHEGLEASPDKSTLAKDQLRQEAMLQIHTLDPKLLDKCQDKIFGEGSKARALFGALDHFSMQGKAPSPYSQVHVNSLKHQLGDLVQTLSSSIGTHTDSGTHDAFALMESGDLGRPALRQARHDVEAYFSKLQPENLVGPNRLLFELKAQLGKFDDSNLPLWHSTETLVRLEDDVRRHAMLSDQDIVAVCDQFRYAIRDDPDLPAILKNKLESALTALQDQEGFHARLAQTREFQGLNENSSWRLFMNGDHSPWDLEQFNQGSLSGLYQSFTYMLDTRNREVDGKYLESLQKVGCQNSFALELQNAFKSNADEDILEFFVENARIPQGFREGTTNLDLDPKNVTPEGRDSLLANQERRGYELKEYHDRITLHFTEKTKKGCEGSADAILQEYRADIGRSSSDDDKLKAIGRAVQDLYCSHLFTDGNTRTVVVNLMNRMLLDNGLSPCILSDPKSAVNCSLEQFVDRIRDGQETFRILTH